MPIKDPEKRKQYVKEWRAKNKERLAKKEKEYRENNKDNIAKKKKEIYEKNKEQITEYNKKYKQTPKGKKINIISMWKRRGLIDDNYNKLYDDYLENTECQECGVTYGVLGDGTTFKCMDHDHETGLFRNFLCTGCNVRRH